MPISLDPMMMREIIMDHYENPRNKEEAKGDGYVTAHMDSTSCIDDIYVQVKLDGDRITDIKWHGTACAISTAATSIMSDLLKGKTAQEAKDLYRNYFDMLEFRPYDSAGLEEALAFMNTGRQPSRIGCATIGWRGVLKLLPNKEDKPNA